ncbi:MAG: hypothetical protein LUC87_05555, partial [Clostridiales bacterium]|nr:hypothetical protein [Clostridiales bacterium]
MAVGMKQMMDIFCKKCIKGTKNGFFTHRIPEWKSGCTGRKKSTSPGAGRAREESAARQTGENGQNSGLDFFDRSFAAFVDKRC